MAWLLKNGQSHSRHFHSLYCDQSLAFTTVNVNVNGCVGVTVVHGPMQVALHAMARVHGVEFSITWQIKTLKGGNMDPKERAVVRTQLRHHHPFIHPSSLQSVMTA